MAVRRVVAAECAAARLARAEVHPLTADLDAFLADVATRVLDVLHFSDVCA